MKKQNHQFQVTTELLNVFDDYLFFDGDKFPFGDEDLLKFINTGKQFWTEKISHRYYETMRFKSLLKSVEQSSWLNVARAKMSYIGRFDVNYSYTFEGVTIHGVIDQLGFSKGISAVFSPYYQLGEFTHSNDLWALPALENDGVKSIDFIIKCKDQANEVDISLETYRQGHSLENNKERLLQLKEFLIKYSDQITNKSIFK